MSTLKISKSHSMNKTPKGNSNLLSGYRRNYGKYSGASRKPEFRALLGKLTTTQ